MLVLIGQVVEAADGDLEVAGLSVIDAMHAVINVGGWTSNLPLSVEPHSRRQYRVTIEEVEVVQVDGSNE